MLHQRAEGHRQRPLVGRRVLVLEDEYFIADDIAAALAENGAEVIGPLGDLAEAENVVRSSRPDAAVLDVNLHCDRVYPLARLLRTSNVPFIFASGYGRTQIDTEFNDVPLWEKPVEPDALVRSLLELMRSR